MKKKYSSPNVTVEQIILDRMISTSILIDDTPVPGDQVEGKANYNEEFGW